MLVPWIWQNHSGKTIMNKKITCGIIGCGTIGPVHAECFQKAPGVRVKWACDLIRKRADVMADKYSIPEVTTGYRNVLRDPEVDCVVVCTDHGSHAEISCAALACGKHVLCEKALAHNSRALNAMMRAGARNSTLVFSGVLQHRFDAVNRLLKKYMDENLLGKMLLCQLRFNCFRGNEYYRADKWRGTWDKEGGSVLINQGIHFIDIAAWLMGGATSVCGFHANRTHRGVIETEDTATASLCFANGALGSITATASDEVRQWNSEMILCGTDGTIEMRNGAPACVDLKDKKKAKIVLKALKKAETGRNLLCGKTYYGSSHPLQVSDFIGAIREKRQPFVTAGSARHCVDIVLAVYKSQKTGRTVTLR